MRDCGETCVSPGHILFSHRPDGLEGELQPELHHAATPRTDQRIGGRVVGRDAAAAKRAAGRCRWVIAKTRAIRCAVRIGDSGVIENVKELHPELCAEPLLEYETLEHGEIHVLEARVTEDVSAHISESSQRRGSQNRIARGVAATSRQIICSGASRSGGESAGGMSHTIGNKRCGISGSIRCAVNPGCDRTRGAAGINRGGGGIGITDCKSRTERYGVRAGLEVGCVPEEILVSFVRWGCLSAPFAVGGSLAGQVDRPRTSTSPIRK